MPSSKDSDRIVFVLRRETQCGRCRSELDKGDFICLTGNEALCLKCAGLAHLEYLPSGDAAVTRRATKHSTMHVVVMKKSPARKRSERQGILAEVEAIRWAEAESVADAEKRAQKKKAAKRRDKEDQAYIAAFAKAIIEQFPGCPREDAQEIAGHACQKYSGRVGRSVAAKQFDPAAVRLAVIAHIRHKYTEYDRLLARYNDRQEARSEVRGMIEEILEKWEQPQ
jgi:hypothetical protein